MALITNSNITNIVKSEDWYVLHCHNFYSIWDIQSKYSSLELYDGYGQKYFILEDSVLKNIIDSKILSEGYYDIYQLTDLRGTKSDYIKKIEALICHIARSKDFKLIKRNSGN